MKPERKCKFLSPSASSPCKHYIKVDTSEPGFCKMSHEFICVEALKSSLPHMSQSSLKNLAQCKYKYWLSKIKGIQTRDHEMPVAVKLGAIWDKFVECKVEDRRFGFDLFESMVDQYQIYPHDAQRLVALFRAVNEIGLSFGEGVAQMKVIHPIGEYCVVGYVDVACADNFKEVKLTGNPSFFDKRFNIQLQVGTYFLANPMWEYVDICPVRRPAQKTGKGKYSDESASEFCDRIYYDIIKRPGYYFAGYNRDEKIFGNRFWRTEFDLEHIETTYLMMFHELHDAVKYNRWPQNSLSCHVPTACWYLPICETEVISDKIYEKREKGGDKNGT